MDQDGTWHGGWPRSRPHCARWGTSFPPQKEAVPPVFGPCLLWPNGCMHQNTTWYGGRPYTKMPLGMEVGLGPGDVVLDGVAAPPKTNTTPFSAHVYCGQTAGWMKTPLGTEVDLGPGHIVLDGDPAPPAKGAQQPPLFSSRVCCFHGRPSQLLLSSCSVFV